MDNQRIESLRLSIPIPALLINFKYVICEKTILDYFQTRIIAMLCCRKELGIMELTIGEALKKIYNIDQKSHVFIKRSLESLFKKSEKYQLSTLFSDTVEEDKFNLSVYEIEVNEYVENDFLNHKFYGLGENEKEIRKLVKIPLVEDVYMREEIISEFNGEIWNYEKTQKMEIEIKKNLDDLKLKNLLNEIISNTINHNKDTLSKISIDKQVNDIALISNYKELDFKFSDDFKIFYDDKMTHDICAQFDFLDIDKIIIIKAFQKLIKLKTNAPLKLSSDKSRYLDINSVLDLSKKIYEPIFDIGLPKKYIRKNEEFFEICKLNQKINFDKIYEEIEWYSLEKISLEAIITENINSIKFESIKTIRDKSFSTEVIKILFDRIEQFSQRRTEIEDLVNEKYSIFNFTDEKQFIKLCKILNYTNAKKYIASKSQVFDNNQDEIANALKTECELSYEDIYELLKIRYEDKVIFKNWDKESAMWELKQRIINYSETFRDVKDTELLKNEVIAIEKALRSIEPIELVAANYLINEINSRIAIINKDNLMEKIENQSVSLRKKMESLVASGKNKSPFAQLMNEKYENNNSVKEIIKFHKVLSKNIHNDISESELEKTMEEILVIKNSMDQLINNLKAKEQK